ncbi:MAG: RrF2 family transcriptional regulator [Eggerthellaceae bacterium]|jgi:Rrf2 family protein
MDITRRCDYACRILRSAFRHGKEYVSIAQISEEENIPYAFARGIQHDLAVAGFLETARGSKGGIRLAKDPAEITMYDVITAVQGEVNMSICSLDTGVCDKCDRCDYRRVWLSSDRFLRCFYQAITLQELFDLGNDHPAIQAVMGSDSEEAGRMLAQILKRPGKPTRAVSADPKKPNAVPSDVDGNGASSTSKNDNGTVIADASKAVS